MISKNQLQSSQSEQKQVQPLSKKKPFSSRLKNVVEIKKGTGNATCLYSQRHNMIFALPTNGTVLFCDPSTLLPLENRKTLEIGNNITAIDYWAESDVYIMGSSSGATFTYNASSQTFEKLSSSRNMPVLSIAFLNSQYYAFSRSGAKQIYVGSFELDNLFSWCSKLSDSVCLHKLAKRNLLFSGLTNGSVVIYRTDQLPKLSIIYSHNLGKLEKKPVININSARICSKEYIITYGSDGKIRIWNLIKGRMRLLRRILIGQVIHSLVYLEEYKLLVITHGMYPAIKLINLINGKFVETIRVGFDPQKLFLMEDKRTIGVVDSKKSQIRMVTF